MAARPTQMILHGIRRSGRASGIGGTLALALLERMLSAGDSADKPVRIRERPGEQIRLVSRRPPSRRERRLAARKRALGRDLLAASKPSRRARSVARRLSRAEHRRDRARPDSRRGRRLGAEAERLAKQYVALTRPSRKAVRLRRRLDATDAVLGDLSSSAVVEARRDRRGRPVRHYRIEIADDAPTPLADATHANMDG